MCSCDSGDPNRVWRVITRKARKEHLCEECGGRILPGYRYHYGSGISADGDAFDIKWCDACDVKLRAFQKAEQEDGCWPELGALKETIRECMREDRDFSKRYLAARRELRKGRVAA